MLKKLLLLTTTLLLITSLFGMDIIVNKTLEIPQSLTVEHRYRRDKKKEVVIDTKLNIMWQDNEDAKNVRKSWEATFSVTAKEYCEKMIFAGYTDWYLPNIKELESIVDVSRYKPSINKVFKNIAPSYYWSSSPSISDSKNAWNVYFYDGRSNYRDKTNKYYIRCVKAW